MIRKSVGVITLLLVIAMVVYGFASSAQSTPEPAFEPGASSFVMATEMQVDSNPQLPENTLRENSTVDDPASEEPEPLAENTSDNPATDFDAVIAQIKAFGDQYEASFVGKAGWVHRVSDYSIPTEYLSNTGLIEGKPVSEVRPHDLMRKEEWFLVRPDGSYITAVGQDFDPHGIAYNKWALSEGKMVFLDLPPAAEYRVQDWQPEHVSVHEYPMWFLQVAQSNNQTVRAWYEGNTYIVVVTIVDEEPVKLDNVGITAIGRESEWIFDVTTGALKSTKQSLQASDGTWVLGQSQVILSQERIEQPPAKILDFLQRAQEAIQEVR